MKDTGLLLGWTGRGAPQAALLALLMASAAPQALAQTAAPPRAPAAQARKPAAKPPQPAAEDDEDTVSELVVTGERTQPGAVVGDIKPEVQLSPADIMSYGVSSVTELLDELAPQIQSGRGRGGEQPVVLINGRRISGFNEIRDIPTEALARVDILPEEVALKYGYSADQKVVNIVLRRFFRAWTAEAGASAPTEGGRLSGSAEGDLMHILRDNRLNMDLKVSGSSAITEDERDVTPLNTARAPYDLAGNIVSPTGGEIDPALSALAGRPVTVTGVPAGAGASPLTLAQLAPTAGTANVTDDRADRTLSGASRSVSANGVLTHSVLGGISATVNGTLGATHSRSLQGLPGYSLTVPAGDPFSPFAGDVALDRYLPGPLTQTSDGWTAHLGTTLNKDLREWRFSLTGNYDHADSLTLSDTTVDTTAAQQLLTARDPTFDPFGPTLSYLLPMRAQNKAHSRSDGLSAEFVASGPLLHEPAGAIYTTWKVGDSGSWFSSNSHRGGLDQAIGLSRNDANAQLNVDVPLTSVRNNVLAWLGDLTANGNVAVHQVSDFGTLTNIGYGLNWRPVTGLSVIVSHTRDEASPSMQQLGGPTVVTEGVRLLDFATGQTVEVRSITGGNPNLTGDHRNVLKVGLNWKPWSGRDLSLTANYVDSRTDNPISTFPAATADIEAAFPDRFVRDASGRLVQVDYRPVNFAWERRRQLRWGFNYSKPLGPQPQRGEGRGFRDGARDGQRPAAAQNDQPQQQAQAAPPPEGGPPPDGPPPGAGAGGPPGGGPGGFGPPGGGGFRGGGGGRGGFRGGGFANRGRLQFAVYHTVYFEDQTLIRPGGPLLDLLHGSAAGSGGGQPRQDVEVQFGYMKGTLGVRLSANWQAGTTVRGVDGANGDLSFSPLTKVDLRLFDNVGVDRELVQRHPWLRGVRVSLAVNNLFDERERVRDATGATPPSYQPAFLDPVGRVVSFNVRKLFFTIPSREEIQRLRAGGA